MPKRRYSNLTDIKKVSPPTTVQSDISIKKVAATTVGIMTGALEFAMFLSDVTNKIEPPCKDCRQ